MIDAEQLAERAAAMLQEQQTELRQRLERAQRFDREPNGVPPRATPATPDYFIN